MMVLIAEDEEHHIHELEEAMRIAKLQVDIARTATDAMMKIRTKTYDLAIIDWRFEGESLTGNDLSYALRQHHPDVPIMFITAFPAPGRAHQALGSGATIFVRKPVYAEEVAAQAIALIRDFRSRTRSTGRIIRNGPLALDIFAHELTIDGDIVRLKPREMELLMMLMSSLGDVITDAHLIEHVWGELDARLQSNSLQVHISRLKKVLGPFGETHIVRAPKIGYRMIRADI